MTLPSLPPPRTNDFRELEKWYQNVTRFYNNPALNIGAGTLDQEKLAAGMWAIMVVDSLPALPNASYPSGSSVVLLTTDGKLYRNVSDSWVNTVVAEDVVAASLAAITADLGNVSSGQFFAGSSTTGTLVCVACQLTSHTLNNTGHGTVPNDETHVQRDDQIHIYGWNSSTGKWLQVAQIGDDSFSIADFTDARGVGRNGVEGNATYGPSFGVVGRATGVGGVGVYGYVGSNGYYGGKFSNGGSKGNILLEAQSGGFPTNSADKGALWVDSSGILHLSNGSIWTPVSDYVYEISYGDTSAHTIFSHTPKVGGTTFYEVTVVAVATAGAETGGGTVLVKYVTVTNPSGTPVSIENHQFKSVGNLTGSVLSVTVGASAVTASVQNTNAGYTVKYRIRVRITEVG